MWKESTRWTQWKPHKLKIHRTWFSISLLRISKTRYLTAHRKKEIYLRILKTKRQIFWFWNNNLKSSVNVIQNKKRAPVNSIIFIKASSIKTVLKPQWLLGRLMKKISRILFWITSKVYFKEIRNLHKLKIKIFIVNVTKMIWVKINK